MRLILGRRRVTVAALLAVVALATAAVAPAAAVRFGTEDGTGHPYVGLMVALNSDGDPLWRCTGTLLSSTVFLTAGHCVQPSDVTAKDPTHVEMWFGAGPIPLGDDFPTAGDHPCAGITGYPCTGDVGGTPVENPRWDADTWWLHDVGLVILDEPFTRSAYGELPDAGELDSLHPGRATTFTAVGYGVQAAFPDAASWKELAERIRLVAHPWLYQINSKSASGGTDLILSDNAAAGGTCFGDSGGPNFIGDTDVVAAVNSFVGNPHCGGLSGAYRIDNTSDLDWIQEGLDGDLP